MSILGNQLTTAAFVTDTFSGNASTTAFTLSVAPATTSSCLVAISGVLQDPSAYSLVGTTMTFSAAPPVGVGNISVRYLGIPASNVTTTAYRTVTEFTATAGQTTFNVPSYTPGYLDTYINGVRLSATDFTASNGVNMVLGAACSAGDLVVTESFYVSSVLNAIPAVAGAVNSSYITDGAVTTSKVADGSATPSKLSIGHPDWDTAGNLKINSGYGSTATAYGCRAWVNFNGQGTVAIRASGNVSSITDIGTGGWIVNFASAMPDSNYVALLSTHRVQTWVDGGIEVASFTTTGYVVGSVEGSVGWDTDLVCTAAFR